jgi:beta-carotene hydroxylase
LLESKGCHQSLGLLQGKDFLHFVYDIFLGIRFHHKAEPVESASREKSS